MHDPRLTLLDETNSRLLYDHAAGYEDKMFLVLCASSAHSLLRFAPKNAMAKTNTGMAINNPRTGMIVKLTIVRAKPTKSKNRPTAKSEILSK
jgi:hypothetical protein